MSHQELSTEAERAEILAGQEHEARTQHPANWTTQCRGGITNEQREAIVRRAVADRDALLLARKHVSLLGAEQHITTVEKALDELATLRAERDSFHMAYRMKCDAETKAQAVEIERLRAQLAAVTAERDALREFYEAARHYEQIVGQDDTTALDERNAQDRYNAATKAMRAIDAARNGA